VIGEQDVDYTFTGLVRDEAAGPGCGFPGASVALWAGKALPVPRDLHRLHPARAVPALRRRCGTGDLHPNALRSGEGLIRLSSGQSHSASWGSRLRPA